MRRISFLMAFIPFLTAQLPVSVFANSSVLLIGNTVGDIDSDGSLGVRLRAGEIFLRADSSRFQCGVIAVIDDYGPARKAGLRAGDTVCSIDGRFFPEWKQIIDYIVSLPSGRKVDVRASHPGTGKPFTTTATVVDFQELSVQFRTLTDDDVRSYEDKGGQLGSSLSGTVLAITDLDGSERQVYGSAATTPIINSDGKIAVGKGDTIFSINDQYFSSAQSFTRFARSLAPGSDIDVEFIRNSDGKSYKVTALMPSGNDRVAVSPPPQKPPVAAGNSASSTDNLVKGAIIAGVAVAIGCAIFCPRRKAVPETEHYPTPMEKYRARGCDPFDWQLNPHCGPPPID